MAGVTCDVCRVTADRRELADTGSRPPAGRAPTPSRGGADEVADDVMNAAYRKLAALHPDEFDRLFREELAAVLADARRAG